MAIQQRTIDAMVWKTGHSCVITIPTNIMKILGIKPGDWLELSVSKHKKQRGAQGK